MYVSFYKPKIENQSDHNQNKSKTLTSASSATLAHGRCQSDSAPGIFNKKKSAREHIAPSPPPPTPHSTKTRQPCERDKRIGPVLDEKERLLTHLLRDHLTPAKVRKESPATSRPVVRLPERVRWLSGMERCQIIRERTRYGTIFTGGTGRKCDKADKSGFVCTISIYETILCLH